MVNRVYEASSAFVPAKTGTPDQVYVPVRYLLYTTKEGKNLRFLRVLSLYLRPWYGTSTMTVRMRHTRSHTRNRRSHHALTEGAIVKDKDSGSLRLPHRVDESTGMYKGKQIAAPKVKKVKNKKEGRGERSQVEVVDTMPDAEKKEQKKTGVLGKVTKARNNSRSGFGGGA